MTTSWRESKDAGRQAFLDSNYPQALFHYSEAIDKLLLSSASSSSPASAAEERLRVDQHGRSGSTAGSSRVGLQQQHHPFQHEHQILLSNVIACRLKIGGTDMAEKAVEEAKQVSSTIIFLTLSNLILMMNYSLSSTFPHHPSIHPSIQHVSLSP